MPASDARVGAEVDRACYTGTRSGDGYVSLGDHDGFIVGGGARQYLLLLSRGCGDLSSPFSFPVIDNRASSCLERGELIQSVRQGTGLSGACRIDRVFEWRGATS